VEIDKGREREFTDRVDIPMARIGHVGGTNLRIRGRDGLICQPIEALRECWSQPLWKLLG
jgi:hypothetical protein